MEKTEALLHAHLYLDTYGGVASITLLTQLATTNIFKSLSGLLCILMSCQDGCTAGAPIFTWLKAFSCYMAVLTSCDSTTSAQTTGLAAHLHLILQLSQELGPQWMKYDIDYRQWAAARNVRQWGELNFTIYRHYLSAQQRFSGMSSHPRPTQVPGNRKSSNPNSKEACFRWNF